MTADIRPARRRSLPQEIVDQLVEIVATGSFSHDRLPSEKELGERLNASRNSLREALSALEQLGVVETRGRARYGNRVRACIQLMARGGSSTPERSLVDDPLEARRILEPEITALAAARMTPEALKEIEEWFGRLIEASRVVGERSVGDGELQTVGAAYLEADAGFHIAIARATGNRTLMYLVAALTDALHSFREVFLNQQMLSVETVDSQHQAVRDALHAGDPVQARIAMTAHLDALGRSSHAILQADPDAARRAPDNRW